MSDKAITIPTAFAEAAVTRDGESGRQWIAELPGLVQTLCQRWNLAVAGAVMHGYLSLVIPVTRGDAAYVVKVSWIDESTREEALALEALAGHGAVRLLATEPALGAMLLEQLDHTHSLEDVEIGEALVIAGRLLRLLAIPAPPGLRRLPAVAAELAEGFPLRWARYGRPMRSQLIEQASALARELGPSAGALLVNYDLHYGNVLAGARAPWLVVDPKAVSGDPEYGIAQLLWCRLEEIEAHGGLATHFQRLCEAAQLDQQRARAWTMVRCVDYWLWGLSVGLTDDPARCAAITDWLV